MFGYHVERIMAQGIVRVYSPRHGSQVWVLANGGSVFAHQCVVCGIAQLKGARLYRPLANPQNRSSRICSYCASQPLG